MQRKGTGTPARARSDESSASSPSKHIPRNRFMLSEEDVSLTLLHRTRDPNSILAHKERLVDDGPPSSPPLPQGTPTLRHNQQTTPTPRHQQSTRTARRGAGRKAATEASEWHIPAMRTNDTPHVTAAAGVVPVEGGRVVRLGRRDAWRRFLCYEGCFQICMNALLQGSSKHAPVFLQDGCRKLKAALELETLFLPTACPDTINNGAIYWDDRDEASRQEELHIPSSSSSDPSPAIDFHSHAVSVGPWQPSEAPLPPLPLPAKSPAKSLATDHYDDVDALCEGLDVYTDGCEASECDPHVEANVIRLIGCGLLGEAGKVFRLVVHPAGTQAESVDAWTPLTCDGGVAAGATPLRLHPAGPKGTLLVQLFKDNDPVAAGTVQVVELEKIASQHQPDANQVNTQSGFLRQFLDGFMRTRRDSPSSMLCIKLVDAQGDTAGHAVLTARQVVSSDRKKTANKTKSPVQPPPAPTSTTSRSEEDRQSIGDLHHQVLSQSQSPLYHTYHMQSVHNTPHKSPLGATAPAAAGMHAPTVNVEDTNAEYTALQLPSEVIVPAESGPKDTSAGYVHIKVQHVYNELLMAALKAEQCGPGKLQVQGSWDWLLGMYVEQYGVPPSYAALAHLRWVVRRANATPTAPCMEVLLLDMAPLLQQKEAGTLSSAEIALLSRIVTRAEELLASCFEQFYALDDGASGGVAEGALVRSGGVPAVLLPALKLLSMLRTDAPQWLSERFCLGARNRFQALLAASEVRSTTKEASHHGPNAAAASGGVSPAAAAAYHRVGELATCLISELKADEAVKHGASLPVNLPDLSAGKYVRGLVSHLQRTLQRHPPATPAPAVVGVVDAVGRLLDYVNAKRYVEAAGRLNSGDIFCDFVRAWISGTARSLARTLTSLQGSGVQGHTLRAGGQNQSTSPVVERMLREVEVEMRQYERIVAHWPVHAPDLEAALVAALRAATDAASKACGLVRTREPAGDTSTQVLSIRGGGDEGGLIGAGRVAWRWAKTGAATGSFKGVQPEQAVLLNSLRRLLAVVPQLESTLRQWCRTPNDPGSTNLRSRATKDGPHLGSHYAQLIKELRTQYYACITLCAEDLAAKLATHPSTSLALLLTKEGLTASNQGIEGKVTQILEHTVPVLRMLSGALEGRVFVAVVRGLWDLTARDVLRYAEDLNEGEGAGDGGGGQKGAWRGRRNAGIMLRMLGVFYQRELAAALGNDLVEKDVAPPQHAERASRLLADTAAEVNMSFDVY